MSAALVLTYHAVGDGEGPLFVDEALFAAQLDCVAEAGATVLTISALADGLRAGSMPDRAVAITFDDGLQSVGDIAAPALATRGLTATVFCVAGRLGGQSNWPSAAAAAPSLPLLAADDLRDLAASGLEIGSHGTDHEPLVGSSRERLRHEIVDSRRLLEQEIGVKVRSFAYPYGAGPSLEARALVADTYDAACTTKTSSVSDRADPMALPRVDAHYLRNPQLLRRALEGSLGPYLRAREVGARARRTVRKDYVAVRNGLA